MNVKLKTVLDLISQTREIRLLNESEGKTVASGSELADLAQQVETGTLYVELRQIIGELGHEEQLDVAAICHIGRFDGEPSWHEACREIGGVIQLSGLENYMVFRETDLYLSKGLKILLNRAERKGRFSK